MCINSVLSQVHNRQKRPCSSPGFNEDQFTAISQLVNSINGMTLPVGAAYNIIPALQNLQKYNADFSQNAASIDFSNQEQLQIVQQTIKDIDQVGMKMFADISILYPDGAYNKCYIEFQIMIDVIDATWFKYTQIYLDNNSEQDNNVIFQEFCSRNREYIIEAIEKVLGLLLGTRGCDVLEDLYQGNPQYNFFSGWRDKMDDLSAYLVSQSIKGITILGACQHRDSSQIQSYNAQFQQAIQRILEYDQKALSSISETIRRNLQFFIDINPGLTPELFILNINQFFLKVIYPDYLISMIVIAQSDLGNGYDVDCVQCQQFDSNEYHFIVDWILKDSNTQSTITQEEVDNIDENQTASEIFTSLGCTSGVVKIRNDIEYEVDQQFEMHIKQGDQYNTIVWGFEGTCQDREY